MLYYVVTSSSAVNFRASDVFFDPLGAATVSAIATITPPTVNSARIPLQSPSYVNYHRQARTHIGERTTQWSYLVSSHFCMNKFFHFQRE